MFYVKGRPPKQDWKNIDWDRPTSEIAAEYNMNPHNISRLRREHAHKTVYKYPNKRSCKIDWFMVDWSKKTSDIATELGFSRCYISIKRREFAPNTLVKQEHIRW